MNLQENLRKLRRKAGLNQKELSQILKVSAGAVGMWETGARTPDINTLEKIAEFYNISVDKLLGKEEKQDNTIVLILNGNKHTYNLSEKKIQAIKNLLEEEEK